MNPGVLPTPVEERSVVLRAGIDVARRFDGDRLGLERGKPVIEIVPGRAAIRAVIEATVGAGVDDPRVAWVDEYGVIIFVNRTSTAVFRSIGPGLPAVG
jgi:hypothetical protein